MSQRQTVLRLWIVILLNRGDHCIRI